MRARTAARGYTLLEVVVSAAILMMILIVVTTTLDQTATVARFDQSQNEASTAARRIMGQMTRELADAGGSNGIDHTSPDRATGASVGTAVIFKQRREITGVDATDWPGEQITYRLQDDPQDTAGNGLDDDKDGVIDERQLVRLQNGTPTLVLDPSVTLFRIDRPVGSDVLTITLEVSRGWQRKVVQQGEWARTRLVTNVLLRNRP